MGTTERPQKDQLATKGSINRRRINRPQKYIRQVYNITAIEAAPIDSLAMINRKFGNQIDNLVSQNHIVLKARSFSYENKMRVPADIGRIQGLHRPLRRVSLALAVPEHDQRHTEVIRDENESMSKRLMSIQDKQAVPEYMVDCIRYMMDREKYLYGIKLNNMGQLQHYEKKRAQLVDWMVSVHQQLKLFPKTLYIAVSYVDVYLCKNSHVETDLEALALTCLLMAGKYEQTYQIPYIRNLLKLSQNPVSKEGIKEIEQKVIQALEFNFSVESPISYLGVFAELVQMSPKNKFICCYILELALLDINFLRYEASLLGASVVYLVNKIRKISPFWPRYLQELIGYDDFKIRLCAKQLCAVLYKSPHLESGKAIRKKYSAAEFCEASKIRLQRKTQ